jgi:S-adenosylmethionine hydrolase
MRSVSIYLFFIICLAITTSCSSQSSALVFQSDFGLKDGAVSAMKGVAFSVSPDLKVFDITHEVPAYNIWEASYRLNQTAAYWPKGTVFVSVVDPGVGSDRKSVVMKSKSGHFFVTPDNGTLTLVAESLGIEEVRQIDEAKNRLKNSGKSYTFHGRDVYAYTGARLAAGVINFEEVGAKLSNDIVRLKFQKPVIDHNMIRGNIDILDVQYGNLWTNIDEETFKKLQIQYGDKIHVKIFSRDSLKFEADMIFGRTFADVPVGDPVAYINSLLNLAIGINQDNFSAKYNVLSGPDSGIVLSKVSGKN